MKFVMVEWIVNFDLFSSVVGDDNLLLLDNLRRRDGVRCPIPIRLTKISGGFLPVLCVDCVCRSDFQRMLLQNLLIK